MQASWMYPVEQGNSGELFAVYQLAQLKKSLKAALRQRDWSLVCRIDRLSAQIIQKLGPNDKAIMREAIKELLEIKTLYQDSLKLIDKELMALSDQAH